ncbi:MAG: hypothetical protein NZ853_08285 [Leptospiraceae bacterium]|nr:hypothetical protein [Leptospiraceae bacterium]MDW7976827.1 hypothetical protein [Leptospiraceae bacterium]
MSSLFKFQNFSYRNKERELLKDLNLEIKLNDAIGVFGNDREALISFFNILRNKIPLPKENFSVNTSYRVRFLVYYDLLQKEDIAINYLIKSTQKEPWFCYYNAYTFFFEDKTLSTPIKELRPSERIRLRLAQVFCENPNFIIFYQPTRFLDFEAQILLENKLNHFRSNSHGYMIFSDDREFLYRTCSSFIEIGNQKAIYHKKNDHFLPTKYFKEIDYKIGILERIKNIFLNRTIIYPYKIKKKILSYYRVIEELESFYKDKIFEIEQNLDLLKNQDLAWSINLKYRGKFFITGSRKSGKSLFFDLLTNPENEMGRILGINKLEKGYYNRRSILIFRNEVPVIESFRSHFYPENKDFDPEKIGLFRFLSITGEDWRKLGKELPKEKKILIYIVGLILKMHPLLVLDDIDRGLNIEQAAKVSILLKHYKGSIIFSTYNRTFAKTIATKILTLHDLKFQFVEKEFDDYIEELRNKLDHDSKFLYQKSIRDYNLMKLNSPPKKNGVSPYKIRDKSNILDHKKGLLLFFDKSYRERKKEIKKLKEELHEMELALKDLEEKRKELWEFIHKYNLHTPENYQKMEKIDQKLKELTDKWKELQNKLRQLDDI